MDELDLKGIIKIIRKRIILIITVPIIFAAIGAIVSIYFIEPVYESSTTLIINQNKAQDAVISKADVDLSKSLIYTYAEMAKSNTVLEKTKQALNLDKLDSNSITVSPVKDTQILKVSVQNTDAKLAKDIANTIVSEFTLEIIRITKTDNVAVVDYAKLPAELVKPNKLVNTAISGILGEIIIILLVFVIEYFDNTLKTEKDVEKYLELSVVGSVPNFSQGSKKSYEKYSNR